MRIRAAVVGACCVAGVAPAAALAGPVSGPHAYGVVSVTQCTDAALRQAIATVPAGGTVDFACDGTVTIDPTQGPIQVPANPSAGPQDVTLDSAGHDVTISGGGQTNMFFVTGGGTVTLRGLTFRDGLRPLVRGYGGGAVTVINTKLVVDRVNFVHNHVGDSSNLSYENGAGGAIDVMGSHGSLTVTNSRFTDNSVACDSTCLDGGGGAIAFRAGGPAVISGTTFTDNSELGGNGGGALAGSRYATTLGSMGPITVSGSTFTGNTSQTFDAFGGAPRGGGAILAYNHALTVTSSQFTDNTASGYLNISGASGGAIRIDSIDLTGRFIPQQPATIQGSTFDGNTITAPYGFGAAVSVDNEPLAIDGSVFTHNGGDTVRGGALSAGNATMVKATRFAANSVAPDGDGGAIWTTGPLQLAKSTITANAPDGCAFGSAGTIVDLGGDTEAPGSSCGLRTG